MRVLNYLLTFGFLFTFSFLSGQLTPHPVNMNASDDNITAFGSNGFIGSDGAGINFYLHWDATYLYFGWEGGQTHYNGAPHTDCGGNQSSDMYFVGIDTQNDSGSNEDIGIVSFSSSVMDYYAVYENNYSHYAGSQGDGRELWVFSGGNWNTAIPRLHPADNGTDGQIDFQCSPNGSVRFRLTWGNIGFSPGPDKPIAFTFWNMNAANDWLWASFPTDNPTSSTGGATVTLSHKIVYSSTGSGVDPSSDGSVQPLAFVLPVELISFDATAKGESVELDWSTAAEMNNSHFTIEHALDGKEFYAIGHVEGAGESTELLRYAYTHEQPAVGTNYYRLAQYDYDGTVSYSEIKMVRIGSGATSVQVFPNPTKEQITIQIDEPVFTGSIQVYDVHGSLVEQQGSRSNTTFDMNTETWDVGIYQLVICPDRGDCITKTIIKQ